MLFFRDRYLKKMIRSSILIGFFSMYLGCSKSEQSSDLDLSGSPESNLEALQGGEMDSMRKLKSRIMMATKDEISLLGEEIGFAWVGGCVDDTPEGFRVAHFVIDEETDTLVRKPCRCPGSQIGRIDRRKRQHKGEEAGREED